MPSEPVYSGELVVRKRYLSADSLRGTYTGILFRIAASIRVIAGECPVRVPHSGRCSSPEPGGALVVVVESCLEDDEVVLNDAVDESVFLVDAS